jgi:lipopolysaccharide export system protein LptA
VSPRPSTVAFAALALACFAAPAGAQLAGTTLDGTRPIHIDARDGIEWQQNNRVYIARGHASATRGDSTVTADMLYAYYRPVSANAASAPGDRDPNPLTTSSNTEIYRLEADGHVVFVNADRTAYGDHAVYDVDKAVMVVTGKDLRIVSPTDTITARDAFEWYDRQQLAVARGNAFAIRAERRMRADVITAEVEKQDNGPSRIEKVNGFGNVLVSSPDQIAHGDKAVYDLDSGIATLLGHVSVTKGENELRGQYAVVDTKNNVSRVLAAPPDASVAGGKPPRVEGLLVPNRQSGPDRAAE